MPDIRRIVSGARNPPFRVSLAAWYKFRIGVTNIGGGASAWADQSGNNRPLLQATAASRPAVLSDGSLLFDGSNDFMQATFTLNQPFTIYLAFRQVSWTSGNVLFDGATGTTRVTQTGSTPGLAANAGSALGTSTTIAVGARGVLAFTGNGTSSAFVVCGGAAPVVTTGDAGANNAGGITLGASRVPSLYSNINVYEMLVYNIAHDPAMRHKTNRYLGRVAAVGGI